MTSFCWFSGSRESSRNCIQFPPEECLYFSLVGAVADDPCPLHFSDCGPVIHDGVMLCAAVIPNRDTIRLPAPAKLIFRDRGTSDQILKQVCATGCVILTIANVLHRVEIGEVRCIGVYEQHLLAGFRMCANHRMFCIGKLSLQR